MPKVKGGDQKSGRLINTLSGARRELARIYRDLDNGDISGQKAKDMGYILGKFMEMLKAEQEQSKDGKTGNGASDFYKRFIDEVHG